MSRLDQRLVDLGLAPSRARAQALIAAGVVEVDGRPATKPAAKTPLQAEITVTAQPNPWVSRAALKLVHALDHFDLRPGGTALDIGASTGGFSQVLLARGAERVHALDVGHGQLHADVASDPRVIRHDGVNARDIAPDSFPPVDWITCDASFISLTKVLPAALAIARPGAVLVALIKPQFEVGRGGTVKGIVRDPARHAEVRARIREFLTAAGWVVTGETESPITGGDGNREFLIVARNPG
ncbi:TlyA family RNA methyltransferase [Rhodobacteraceae bacterium NNCM2]|nr:TlyA family RNA methyltransferase [Coraliihabitans acroporae]